FNSAISFSNAIYLLTYSSLTHFLGKLRSPLSFYNKLKAAVISSPWGEGQVSTGKIIPPLREKEQNDNVYTHGHYFTRHKFALASGECATDRGGYAT
ncbi:MAG: hypothetical protein KIH69_020215, partial [Anaerolineae bacterium]|nr:hypothetical protein [Anaerolineae bacterium]